MKNQFLFLIVISFLITFSSEASAQSSVRFIDGIELRPELLEQPAIIADAEPESISKTKKFHVGIRETSGKLATELCKRMQFKYAQLMDVEIEDIANLSMFGFIEDWWSTRYRFGGASKNGVDCSALTGLLFCTVYGIILPRTANDQYKKSQRITRGEIKEGDLVFFNTRGGISHVGVYLANNYFVHSSVGSGVTISSLDDDYYHKKYVGAGRIVQQN